MTKRHVDYVRDYAENLCPVIPHDATLSPRSKIDPGERGKVPGQKRPDGTWYGGWKTLGVATIERAQMWDAMGAGIGSRGGFNGVGASDIDLTVRQDAERARAIAHELWGPKLAVRRVDHPDHTKLLIMFRLEGQMPKSFNVELTQSNGKRGGIQFLGPGRYWNMHGIHPKRLRPYIWENDPADVPLTLISLAEFEAYWTMIGREFKTVRTVRVNAPSEVVIEPERCSPEEAEALIALIPNDDSFEAYEDFIRMGSAIYGASGGAAWGRSMWLAWCEDAPQEQEEKPEIFWDTMLKVRIGADMLRVFANQRDPLEMARRAFANPPIEEIEPELVAESDADADLARSFLEDWCLIGGEGFCRLPPSPTLRPMKSTAFGLVHAAHEKAIRRALGGDKRLSLAKLFARRSKNLVDGMAHEPGQDRLISENGRQFVNLWSPPARPWLGKPIDPTVIAFYRELALFVFGDPEIVRLWELWHAWLLQNPGRAPGWHWIIHTGTGLGKDLLLEPLRRAHGADFFQATPEILAEKFNPYAEDHLVSVSEMKERPKANIYTKLQLITSGIRYVMIRNIGRAPYQARNVVGLVIYSNERHPLEIPATDRRFRVVANFEARQREPEYYAGARALFDQHWPMISEHLHTMRISDADQLLMTANAPQNEAKSEMAEKAWEQVFADIVGELESPHPPVDIGPVATTGDLIKEFERRKLPPGEMPNARTFPTELYALGARPVSPDKRRHYRANPVEKAGRIWRIARVWTDQHDVEWNLETASPTRLAKLYTDRQMPPFSDLKVVDENEP